MDPNTYSTLAARTAKLFDDPRLDQQHAFFGLVGEVGEITDQLKRHLVYGAPLDYVNLSEEIGDLCWYLNLFAITCVEAGPSREQLLETLFSPAPDGVDMTSITPNVAIALLSAGACNFQAGAADSELKLAVKAMRAGIVALCLLYGLSLQTALSKNISKLAQRYGEKYSDYAALNRDTGAERSVLEGS